MSNPIKRLWARRAAVIAFIAGPDAPGWSGRLLSVPATMDSQTHKHEFNPGDGIPTGWPLRLLVNTSGALPCDTLGLPHDFENGR
jgi:hypothetical protein